MQSVTTLFSFKKVRSICCFLLLFFVLVSLRWFKIAFDLVLGLLFCLVSSVTVFLIVNFVVEILLWVPT